MEVAMQARPCVSMSERLHSVVAFSIEEKSFAV
jgi:hypothetical protein